MTRKLKPPKAIYDHGLIFPICQQFFDGRTTTEIAKWVNAELREKNLDETFTRQLVYPTVSEAVRLNYVKFCPPMEKDLEQKIAAIANSDEGPLQREVSVAMVRGKSSTDYLASVVAEKVFFLIKKRAAEKRRRSKQESVPIHIGLGAGRTTQRVARSLGQLLRATDVIPGVSEIHFHALSSGFVSDDPLASPVAFFSFLSDSNVDVKYVALYSQPLVKVEGYETIKKLPGAEDAFEQAGKIDIVVSSLADVEHSFGLLNQLERQYKQEKTAGRVGDVQFRPYSDEGPLEDDPNGYRAVTLFELEDFVKMVEEQGKYLILVCPPNRDDSTRARALLPLIKNPLLKVWSHLFLDFDTAKQVVNLLPPPQRSAEIPERNEEMSTE